MSKSQRRPVGRPKTTDLVTFSVKIPRKLQAHTRQGRRQFPGLSQYDHSESSRAILQWRIVQG